MDLVSTRHSISVLVGFSRRRTGIAIRCHSLAMSIANSGVMSLFSRSPVGLLILWLPFAWDKFRCYSVQTSACTMNWRARYPYGPNSLHCYGFRRTSLSTLRSIRSALWTAAAIMASVHGLPMESNRSSVVLRCRATRIPAIMSIPLALFIHHQMMIHFRFLFVYDCVPLLSPGIAAVLSIRLAPTKQSTLNASIPAVRISQGLREPSQSMNDQAAGGSPGLHPVGDAGNPMLCCNASAYHPGNGAKNRFAASSSRI